MPPQTTNKVGKLRSDLGIAPYVRDHTKEVQP